MNSKFLLTILLSSLMLMLGITNCFADNITNFPIKGGTLSNIILQKDTAPSVLSAVAFVNRNCNNRQITNSKVLKQPNNNMWQEEWTVNACNINYYVPITFIIDATGATFLINPKNIHQ